MARTWWVLLALVLLAGGAVVAAWDYSTRQMERGLLGWAEARRAEGWRVAHTPAERVGFPFSPGIRLGLVSLDLPAGFGWRAERATLSLSPADWKNLHLALEGPQGLRVPGGVVPVTATSLTGRIALDGGEGMLLGEGLRPGPNEVGRLSLRLRPGQFDLVADALRLPGLGNLRLDGARLVGRLNPMPQGTARQWRDAGGTLLIEQMELRQGAASASLNGGLALDAQLQPEGRGQMQLVAPGEAVRLLAEAGLVPPQVAGPLRALAGLGARAPAGGGPPRLDIVLELRNRRLTAGRLPVATLPEMEWR